MPTNYPSNLDNLSNPTSLDYLDSSTVPHATQHTNLNDAVEAIQATLGINPQGGAASVKARLEDVENDIALIGSGIVASLSDGTVAGSKLIDATITSDKIANDSISADKLQSNSVTSSKIVDGSVSANKLATDAVTYEKIGDSTRATFTRVASQAVSGTSSAYISWTAAVLDASGFITGLPNTTLIVPTGKGGLYTITAAVEGFNNHANDYLKIEVSTGSISVKAAVSGTSSCCTFLGDISAGGTIKVLANNGSGSSANLSGRITVVKLFDV